MNQGPLVRLTEEELAEQKRVSARRLPPGLHPGPLDLNRIIPIDDSLGGITEGRKRRIEKKRQSFKAKFPERLAPQDRTESDYLELILDLLNNQGSVDEPFTLHEIRMVLGHYSTTTSMLYSLMSSAIFAEMDVEKGPEFDRRIGSRGRIIKWDYEQLDDRKGIAYYQRSYRGWYRTREGEWIDFPGPSLPISQLEFLRYRFNEIRSGVFQEVSVIRLPVYRDERM